MVKLVRIYENYESKAIKYLPSKKLAVELRLGLGRSGSGCSGSSRTGEVKTTSPEGRVYI
jgi:hypothetical protein